MAIVSDMSNKPQNYVSMLVSPGLCITPHPHQGPRLAGADIPQSMEEVVKLLAKLQAQCLFEEVLGSPAGNETNIKVRGTMAILGLWDHNDIMVPES